MRRTIVSIVRVGPRMLIVYYSDGTHMLTTESNN